jgi:hypothetical protein
MQSNSVSHSIPVRVLTIAALTGVVTAFVGALFARTLKPDEDDLDPEHPLFGR